MVIRTTNKINELPQKKMVTKMMMMMTTSNKIEILTKK